MFLKAQLLKFQLILFLLLYIQIQNAILHSVSKLLNSEWCTSLHPSIRKANNKYVTTAYKAEIIYQA